MSQHSDSEGVKGNETCSIGEADDTSEGYIGDGECWQTGIIIIRHKVSHSPRLGLVEGYRTGIGAV